MLDTQDWGARLRQFRNRARLKQEAAAEHLGISQAYLSRIENGAAAPSQDLAARIETVLCDPAHRATFDHWRMAIRHCPAYATITRRVRGDVQVVEISIGIRDLGAPFDAFLPGDPLRGRLGEVAQTDLDWWMNSGVFDGELSLAVGIWMVETQGVRRAFRSTATPVRDDDGAWHALSWHVPISNEEYMAATRQDRRVLAIERF